MITDFQRWEERETHPPTLKTEKPERSQQVRQIMIMITSINAVFLFVGNFYVCASLEDESGMRINPEFILTALPKSCILHLLILPVFLPLPSSGKGMTWEVLHNQGSFITIPAHIYTLDGAKSALRSRLEPI